MLKFKKINSLKYKTDKYIIIPFYFLKITKTNFLVYIYIYYKLYLVNGFRANILISNNLIHLKNMTINIAIKLTYIKSCKIIVLLKII